MNSKDKIKNKNELKNNQKKNQPKKYQKNLYLMRSKNNKSFQNLIQKNLKKPKHQH